MARVIEMRRTSRINKKGLHGNKQGLNLKTKQAGQRQSESLPTNLIFHLHQSIGNRAIQRLIESNAIQEKITIGQPNDKYEREADRVADQITRMSDTAIRSKPT